MNASSFGFGNMSLLAQLPYNQKTNKLWILVYIRSGVGMCIVEGNLKCLNTSDLLFFPPQSFYSFRNSDLGDEYNENIDAVVLYFGEQWLEMLQKVFRRYSNDILQLREGACPLSVSGRKWLKIVNLLTSVESLPHPDNEASVVLQILHLLADRSEMTGVVPSVQEDSSENRMKKIDDFISCHLVNKFSLDEIATYSGMSRTYFCLFFKKHYGVSLTEFVNDKRIAAASSMLLQTDLAISDIAVQCGFPTVTYFNRMFRKQKGISPRTYRSGSFK